MAVSTGSEKDLECPGFNFVEAVVRKCCFCELYERVHPRLVNTNPENDRRVSRQEHTSFIMLVSVLVAGSSYPLLLDCVECG